MVKHSYPDFHIAFHCFLVDIETSQINLTGHVVKQWLDVDVLLSFDWTAADILAGQKIIDNTDSEFRLWIFYQVGLVPGLIS